MKFEIDLFDADFRLRSMEEMRHDLEQQAVEAALGILGCKGRALAALKIAGTTHRRRMAHKEKPPERKKRGPKPKAKPNDPPVKKIPPAKIVSDLGYLDAKDRFDPNWPQWRDDQLRERHAQNLDTGAIAIDLGLSVQTVERRMAKIGLRPSAGKLKRENGSTSHLGSVGR